VPFCNVNLAKSFSYVRGKLYLCLVIRFTTEAHRGLLIYDWAIYYLLFNANQELKGS